MMQLGLPAHVVHGNNLGDAARNVRLAAKSGGLISYHGADADIQLGGRRIFLVHYPHYGRAIAATGDYDLVCCGHSHKAEITAQPNLKGGTDLARQSGNRRRARGAAATYVIGDLDTLSFEIYELAR